MILSLPLILFVTLYEFEPWIVPYFYWIPHFPMGVLIVNYVSPQITSADFNVMIAWLSLLGDILLWLIIYLWVD
jgi:hypothetical protein